MLGFRDFPTNSLRGFGNDTGNSQRRIFTYENFRSGGGTPWEYPYSCSNSLGTTQEMPKSDLAPARPPQEIQMGTSAVAENNLGISLQFLKPISESIHVLGILILCLDTHEKDVAFPTETTETRQ